MADLPAIPVAEFSPAWHQYQILLRDRLEDRLAVMEELLGVGSGEELEDEQRGILLQGLSPSIGLGATGSLTTTPFKIVSQTMTCLKSTSRVIVRGAAVYYATSAGVGVGGFKAFLYVDGVDSGIDPIQSSILQHAWTTVFSFDYSPGDTNVHEYAINVTASVVCSIADKERWMQCEEWNN
ncbi:MAG: hypothetical protein GY938_24350 [Ketobacter sp.]|nr:hypothetical protein [Ketobacter sp.]